LPHDLLNSLVPLAARSLSVFGPRGHFSSSPFAAYVLWSFSSYCGTFMSYARDNAPFSGCALSLSCARGFHLKEKPQAHLGLPGHAYMCRTLIPWFPRMLFGPALFFWFFGGVCPISLASTSSWAARGSGACGFCLNQADGRPQGAAGSCFVGSLHSPNPISLARIDPIIILGPLLLCPVTFFWWPLLSFWSSVEFAFSPSLPEREFFKQFWMRVDSC